MMQNGRLKYSDVEKKLVCEKQPQFSLNILASLPYLRASSSLASSSRSKETNKA